MNIAIAGRRIGPAHPVYFIADLAANHGGDLVKARELVHACAEAGVDAVKMQNFAAESIVSDYGFRRLGNLNTHQSTWKQSVFESYAAASIPLDWSSELRELCDRLGLHYFTSPYSLELVRAVAPHVSAFKLGSGDITWHDEIAEMCRQGKPVLLATGASSMADVEAAMTVALAHSHQLILMQCNTEYTSKVSDSRAARLERFAHINLRVLETYAARWPGVPLGLSDHTHGSLTVLGAVGLFDCCVVEKHFTLDNTLDGQDHAFSMTPQGWREMVEATRRLKTSLGAQPDWAVRLQATRAVAGDDEALNLAIGDGIKRIEPNERGPVVVQRRALRAVRALGAGERLRAEDLVPLRPCPPEGLPPYRAGDLVGRVLTRAIPAGECVAMTDVTGDQPSRRVP